MPESSSVQDRVKHDKDFVTELMKEVLDIEFHDEDIKSMFRLGKWVNETTLRPIMIQFKERSQKNKVMESLSKLKTEPERFKNLSVTHDLTEDERAE